MKAIGVAVDGGKDSLSMAASANDEVVKAPGALVITCYAECPDVRRVVTPDLKSDDGVLYLLTSRRQPPTPRSAAQVQEQLGDTTPDADAELLGAPSPPHRPLCSRRAVCRPRRLDGGLLVTLLEMAFSGDRGIKVELSPSNADGSAIGAAFAERSA